MDTFMKVLIYNTIVLVRSKSITRRIEKNHERILKECGQNYVLYL
jgi:hypothetical protein